MSSADTSPASKTAWARQDWLWLTLVIVITAVVRFTHIDANPSLDELWHLGLTAGNGSPMSQFAEGVVYTDPPSWTRLEQAAPWWKVWSGMDGVLHPPLYCLTLRIWRNVFGVSDAAAHIYSIVWSLITIGFLFDTARRSMSRVAAVLVSVAMGVSQSQNYFAQEIRSYEMMIALMTIALWLMTRIELERVTRKRTVALAWLTLVLLYTHYFAFGGALAIGIWGLLRLKPYRARFLVHLVIAGIVYGITWVPFAIQQVNDIYTGDSFLYVPDQKLSDVLLAAMCAPIRPVADRFYQQNYAVVLAALMFVLPWFWTRRFRPAVPWMILLCSGVGVLIVLDVSRSTLHLSIVRYFAIITPAVFLLMAGMFWAVSRWIGYALAVGAIAFGSFYTFSNAAMYIDCPDLSYSIETLAQRIKPGEGIVAYPGSGPSELNDMVLMTVLHRTRLQGRAILSLRSPLTEEQRAQLPNKVWLVTRQLKGRFEDVVPGAKDLPDSYRNLMQFVHLQFDPTTGPALQPTAEPSTTRPAAGSAVPSASPAR